MRMKAISVASILLILAPLGFGQIDDTARDAIDKGDYVRAINILSSALADRPTADTYIYLGIAYGRTKEYQKAQDVLNEGSKRYPNDARFHDELAKLFLENNDSDAAKTELRQALLVDSKDAYASDMLATIDLSEGDVQSALRSWNKSGRPIINDILHNYYLNFGSWFVRRTVAFHPSGILRYGEWKTTEARLFETGAFMNVGLEIEPTRIPDQYNAVVRTSAKTNTVPDFLFNAVKGAPFQTSFVDFWNIGNSGVNFNGNYRWDANRRRVQGGLKIPLPLFGLTYLELGNIWRSERWNLSPVILPQFLPEARLDYKSNGLGIAIQQIPNYRVQWGAWYEYRNRAASGDLPQIYTNNINSGRAGANTNILLFDRRYQSKLHLSAFTARPYLLGGVSFTGGVAELANRLTVSKDTRTYINWSVKTGGERGALPVEDYFVLGLDTLTINPLRGHTTARDGHYGNGPMGTDFVLVNTDVDRHLATIPLFNALNIPFLSVSWQLFFDGAKTWDRTRTFQQGKLLLDAGGGVRFETPTHSFNLIYGRALREGNNVFFAYYERRLW
jgi:tetratricopeptide (TPR) repeat protein